LPERQINIGEHGLSSQGKDVEGEHICLLSALITSMANPVVHWGELLSGRQSIRIAEAHGEANAKTDSRFAIS